MMKIKQQFMKLCAYVAVLGGFLLISPVSASGPSYVQYCSGSVLSPRCATRYADDIHDANRKASDLIRTIRRYSDRQQEQLLDKLVIRLSIYYRRTDSTREQVVVSYYIDYFKNAQRGSTTDSVDDIILDLLGSSSNTISVEGGRFTSIRAGNSQTRISNERITVRSGTLDVDLIAKDGRDLLQDDDVRVVAELYDGSHKLDTVAANERSGTWTLRLSSRYDDIDSINFVLLCDECSAGRRYDGYLFDSWRVLDTQRYDVSMRGRSSSYDYDRYNRYGDDYDLTISELRYEYDRRSDEVEVDLEVTVANIGDEDAILERLTYEVELDNHRVSSRDYDIRHIRTECDDRRVDRDDRTNIRIDERDECTITVELTFDEDDVEDEYLEIEVTADARRDDRRSNNTEQVRFYVD